MLRSLTLWHIRTLLQLVHAFGVYREYIDVVVDDCHHRLLFFQDRGAGGWRPSNPPLVPRLTVFRRYHPHRVSPVISPNINIYQHSDRYSPPCSRCMKRRRVHPNDLVSSVALQVGLTEGRTRSVVV